ncbi:MAG: hypothetical protein EXR71_10530 [Myxococcales bacterium]|nr:hypothetical protein [Myxococcales bacterium]
MILLLAACLSGEPAGQAAAPVPAPPAAVPPPAPVGPRQRTPPGFDDLGPVDTAAPGPIYLTVSLNINDFLRPEREARAVRDFLEMTDRLGIRTVELSLTGEVLDALFRVDPALVALIRARRPTIGVHPRMLAYRHLDDTAHQLFALDLPSLTLDRTRGGPLVRMQQLVGVTPRQGGGVLAEALRSAWRPAPGTAALRAAGVEIVDKGETLGNPMRPVASALAALPNYTAGHGGVDGWVRAFRAGLHTRSGGKARDLDRGFVDLGYWVHLALLQGYDVGAIPAVRVLLDPAHLGGFSARADQWEPTQAEWTSLRARPDALARLDHAFAALCAAACGTLTYEDELTLRLGELDPRHAWVARSTWHASDDFSVEPWGANLVGKGWSQRPVRTRPEAEQQALLASHQRVYAAMAANPRVVFVSVDNDTQWAEPNAPGVGWPSVFGVDLARFPLGFDEERLEAEAAAKGFSVKGAGRGGKRGGRGAGRRGAAGEGPAED